jgi:hypothetical protein
MRTATALNVSGAALAASAGLAPRAFAATGSGGDGTGLVIWGFISFCALILVGQLLPAFINFLSARKVLERRIQEDLTAEKKLEQVHSVFDKR